MKRGLFVGFMFAVIMLVAMGSVAYAHHKPGHSGEPGGGKGEDPPAGDAGIDLINCSEGIIATWGTGVLTFKINDISGVGANVIDAVRAGVLEWSAVQSVYTLNEITSGTPDVNIDLFNKIVPGRILGAADVCSTSSGGVIQSVDISIGVRGLAKPAPRTLVPMSLAMPSVWGTPTKTATLWEPGSREGKRGSV